MATIEQHISELLFDHDCVIVPSMGGFLASNQNSLITANQVVLPPFRKIAFNVYLKNNDGLLANHLVEYDHISYQDALVRIEKYVSTCLTEMNSGKKIYLNNIGTIFYDREHNVQFEASRNSNHLKDSFGMDALQLIPVNREISGNEKLKPILKEIRPSRPAKRATSPRIKRSSKIVGVVALAATALWFSFNLYLVNPKQFQTATLNPFDTQTVLKIKDTSTFPPAVIKNDHTSKVETVYVKTTTPVEQKRSAEPHSPSAVPEKNNIVVSPPQINQHHFIVAGVFKIEDNATAFVEQLHNQGFASASITEANHRWYVYYQGFESRNDAIAMNDSLKKNNLQGWIWNY